MEPRKIAGIALFFAGLGIWIAIGVWLVCVVVLTIVPALPLVFLAGLLTNAFQRTAPWPAFRSYWGWRWARRHLFKFKLCGNQDALALYRDEQTDEGKQKERRVIWAIYPHGHFSLTAAFLWGTNPAFAHTKGAIHSAIFWLPVVGSVAGWLGCTSVTEEDMKSALLSRETGGGRIFMCPGGVADASNTGTIIKRRRGFLRIARETNAVVIPVWAPMERSYYYQWLPLGHTLEKWFFFPVPMFIWGRWWCPLVPRAVEESPVFLGKPVRWDNELPLSAGETLFWERLEELQRLSTVETPRKAR